MLYCFRNFIIIWTLGWSVVAVILTIPVAVTTGIWWPLFLVAPCIWIISGLLILFFMFVDWTWEKYK